MRNCPPVLMIIFNRPDLTRQVFERVREARPSQLFIAADGPRPHRPNDSTLCAQARAVTELIDWDCEAKRFYREDNAGCKISVYSAITWLFESVESGIILEDDCFPARSFFTFCAELLDRFRDDARILMISGRNDLGEYKSCLYSYDYTLGNIWGWATWKRAWQLCDIELVSWHDPVAQRNMEVFAEQAPGVASDIKSGCLAVIHNGLDTWDYQWAFTRIAHQGLGIIPRTNLIKNIGFGVDATHTASPSSLYARVPIGELTFPLTHNPDIKLDFKYYAECNKLFYKDNRSITTRIIELLRAVRAKFHGSLQS